MMRRPTFRAGPTTGIWAGLPAFVALVLLAAHLAQAGVAALAIDPTSPMTLYAGTTFPDAPPIGVHKSTDGGRTWNPTGLADIDVSSLAIDPTAPMTLYAGTIAGVHKSIDGGRGWNPSGLDGFYIYRLVIDPTTTPLTIYAYALSILGSSLLTSTDGGGTWNEAHGSGPADPPVPAIAYSRTPGGGSPRAPTEA